MFTSDTIWGIDIGDSCIKAVRLRKTKKSIIVEDYSYVELEQDIKDKEGHPASLKFALERLAARKIFTKTEACITISAKNINNRFISVPVSDKPKQFEQNVQKEAKRQIPFPLEEVQWGFHRMPDRDGEAQVALFAARNEHIEEVLKLVTAVGIDVRGIQAPGLALYNFVTRVADINEHLVILDFGEKTTDLLVVHDKSLWLRSLPLSGSHITALLEQKFRITTKEANTLKHEMERSTQKDKLFRVIEPKLKDLVIEIKRSINFRKTQVHNLQPTQFLACGGSSQLPGVAEYFVNELKLEQFKIDLDELDLSTCPEPAGLEDNLMSYGVAIGLALQGLEEAEATLNLIPRSHIREQSMKSKRVMILVANIVLVFMVAALYFSGSGVVKRMSKYKEAAAEEQRKVSAEIAHYNGKNNDLFPIIDKSKFLTLSVIGNDWVPVIYGTVCKIMAGINDINLVSIKLLPMEPEDYSLEKPAAGSSVPLDERRVRLELIYLGANAKINKHFVEELLKHELFKVKEGDEIPQEVGKTETYSWVYNPTLRISNDPFKDNKDVLQKRRANQWDFGGEKEEVMKYTRSRGAITLSVNTEYFKNNYKGYVLANAPAEGSEE